MNCQQQFCNAGCAGQMHIAERELSAFIGAVTQLFGPDEAKLSVEDWFDEFELVDGSPRSTRRDWRAVSIAASARLAKRLIASQQERTSLVVSADTKASPIPSSNCFSFTLLL